MELKTIQSLPTEVVNLIAAGEVIDSLAAVVRELVENALDAGARRLVVSLDPEQWRVRVVDNGSGMSLANLRHAAAPHSTSKISRCEDLQQITTLGFRGEALHSLAQLAELEILSRSRVSHEGWRVIYSSQGEAIQIETAAIAPGTVVTASNIFGNWVARRQGLPSMSQQLRMVQTTIQHIALCHPHITWQVEQNGRDWFTISPGATAQQILPQIVRQVRLGDLHQLSLEVPSPQENATQSNIPSKIESVLGLPDRCHRPRPDWVRVATNGRFVRSPELEQVILSAFGRTLPRNRYPVCFLHLQISPHYIDWNRHPAKAEIYLYYLDYWKGQIIQAIEQALRINPETLPEAVHTTRVGQLLKAAEEKGSYNLDRSVQLEQKQQIVKNPEGLELLKLRAVAQVHNTYIMAEHSTGLWLVEQHIAHERILYEQLCDRWQLIPLEPPVLLSNLSPLQLQQLHRLGLEVEPFGDRLWAVRNIPELLAQREDRAEALLELSLGGDLQAAQVAVACRSAIRNGTLLTLPEMQTLLDCWKVTRHPRTCPHGRPIYLSLEESALARFFRRNWVIGKSHGI